MRNLLFVFLSLLFVAGITSCKKDNEAKANFSFTAENLVVKFDNTSTDATSYTWDFGDGNTSTETSPSHTYTKNGTYTVKLTATGDGKSNSISKDVTVGSQYKQDGYVIGSLVQSSGGRTYYGGYFNDLPQDIDLISKTAYQRIEFKEVRNGFIYGWPTDNSNGLSKMAVDQSGELVTIATIPTTDFVRGVVILNDELGFFNYFYKGEVVAFNPTTMKVIKKITLDNANVPEGFEEVGYSDMHYNKVTNKLYLTLYLNNSNPPTFYDYNKVIVEVVDVPTQSWEKSITHDNAMYALLRGSQGNVADDEGNTYILCQGSYGLDGQVGPTASKASRPQILKINSNSEFDTDYAFNPINNAGFANNFFQLATNLLVVGDKGYIIGTAKGDSPEILVLLQKFAAGTLTQEEQQQLYSLVLYDESMKLMEIDLKTKETKVVDNFPLTAGFSYPDIQVAPGGKLSVQGISDGATFNGFYEVDPSTGSVGKLFNLTTGGIPNQFIDLGASFE